LFGDLVFELVDLLALGGDVVFEVFELLAEAYV
jgi:hypothetical protein